MQHERLKGEFRESISRYYSVQNVSVPNLFPVEEKGTFFEGFNVLTQICCI